MKTTTCFAVGAIAVVLASLPVCAQVCTVSSADPVRTFNTPGSATFAPSDYGNAAGGPLAAAVAANVSWIPSLPCDPSAPWISPVSTTNLSSALYAVTFTCPPCSVDSATLDFCYAVDNQLGNAINEGLHLNGTAITGTSLLTSASSNFNMQHQLTGLNVTSLVVPGLNTLYIFANNLGGADGLVFSATLTMTGSNSGTVGVPDVNDLTINGIGSGGDCAVPLNLPEGPQVTDFRITSYPGAVVIGALSGAVQCCNIPIDLTYSVDIATGGTFKFWYPQSSPPFPNWVGTPTSTVNTAGEWVLSISHDLPLTPALAIQFGLIHWSFYTGVGTTQAFGVTIDTSQTCVGTSLTPLSDDGFIFQALSNSFTFYGASYTGCYVNMNGNITFGAGDMDFSSNEAEMLSGAPRISPCWDDFKPSAQGDVLIADNGTTWSVQWCDVIAFGCSGDSNTFSATMDYASGRIEFDYGVMQLCTGSPSTDQVVGISPGFGIGGPNNVDLCPGWTIGSLGQAIYEDFGQAAYGAFDLEVFVQVVFDPLTTAIDTYLQLWQ